jgi:hypothetical protein
VRPDTITHPLKQTWIALCCLAIIGALVLGVGLGSHLVLRHVVQTAPPLDWGDSRVSSFPGSGLEHPTTVLIPGGIDDLYLAVSARHIQFPEWAFFYPGDRDDGRSWDRVLVWNCNVRPVKVLSLVDD